MYQKSEKALRKNSFERAKNVIKIKKQSLLMIT